MNIEFESLLRDESFVDKITKGGAEAEQYVKNLVLQYPEKKEDILFAIQFIKSTTAEHRRLSGDEASEIWSKIRDRQKLEKITPEKTNRKIFSTIWKVAAGIVILIGLGYYFHSQSDLRSFKQIVESSEKVYEEGVLILSDGLEHKLQKNESAVEYDPSGEEIFITEAGNTEKKLKNPANERQKNLNQIIVPFGRRHCITLCDGTTVQLNSGSQLIFPANFTGNNRKVYLKGEGYFEVAKNSAMPFVVITDYLDIDVTGTIFNISAYEDEKTASAVLVEGSVNVTQKNKLFSNPKYTLEPGQGYFYSINTSKATVNKVDIINYVGWKDGWLQFKDQPLINIVRRVEKYYNKEILIKGEELANTLISGKLVLSDEFDDAVIHLAKTVEGHLNQNEKQIYIITE
ncbi:FecR family protein [Maribellus maritimus]|uniref:FecR family protein n=1 Tax=Maribellus maritimus TaxID=2870838 RepID=UPI001EEC1C58|nr:FecR domain-containing protein [Maribellus maritimus]MCG6191110.1 FecR domain-containing protein [Maribellus maritimus]